MAWVFLLIAGLGEMMGVFFLKLSDGFKNLVPSIFAFLAGGISFYFLSLSLTELPIGTAYGIWTGIGSVGTVIIGIFFFKDKTNMKRLAFILCIITGVVGLKLVS